MPRVPQAQRQVQTAIATGQQLNVQTSREAFGGGESLNQLTQAATKTLGTVESIVQKQRDEAAKVEYNRLYKKAIEAKNAAIHGKNGYYNYKGRDAADQFKPTKESFSKTLAEIEKDTSNDKVKAMFGDLKNKLEVELDGQMQSHSFREMQEYDNQESAALIEQLKEDAILNYREQVETVDPMTGQKIEKSKIQINLEEQSNAIEDLGERNGWPEEMIKNKQLEAKSGTHYGIITRMINNSEDKLAKEYFNMAKEKGEFTPEDITKLEKVVNTSNIIGESQRFTDDIMNRGISQSEALVEARKITDPELRDETVRRVKNRYAENKQLEALQQEENYNKVLTTLEQTRTLDGIPKEQLLTMSGTQISALKKREAQLAKGKTTRTNLKTYNDLMTMATTPEMRDAFLGKVLGEHVNDLSESDYKKFVDLQGKLRKNDPAANGIVDGFRSDRQVVTDALRSVKIDPKKKPDVANKFYYMIDEKVQKWKEENNSKSIPNTELQKMVDDMLVQGVIEGSGFLGFFQTEKRKFELERGEFFRVEDIEQVPTRDYTLIEDALRKKNIPVTKDKVLELYNKNIGKMNG